ncbi:hypothetical protein LZ575_17290 [Antarcticibacterium sp. 1MA-6-2]|uniref:hypothetical protein n=1 Tax=Antarcticibacterium sp. 1MA-6-2 TaxID=2908210 RepID=UPI001F165341|nr:hypothetical protein [Antarcticibacterium sp. 1MA-6-2]UJH90533.1 hypothetical protein LZ575_17290 [Antarcticibacterium sp. 1MA-6-2]
MNYLAVFERNRFSHRANAGESAELFNTSWTPETKNAPLDTRFGFTHGQRIYSNDKENLGYFLGINYRNSHRRQSGLERTLNSEGSSGQDFRSETFEYTTQKSSLFSLNYNRFEKLKLEFNTIYLQNTSNFIREAA